MSVRPSAQNNSAPTEWILKKFLTFVFFENLSRKFKRHYNRTKIRGSLHENNYKFSIIFRSFLLKMRNVSGKVVEKIKTHIFVFSNVFFENRTVYEIMWENIVERARP